MKISSIVIAYRREFGLRKFLPQTVIDAYKNKDLRRQICREFKNIANYTSTRAITEFLDTLKKITRFDQEIFPCSLGVSAL